MDQVTLNFADASFVLYCAIGDGPEVKATLDKLVAAYDALPAKDASIAAMRKAVDVAFVFIASSKPSLGLTLRERFDEVMPILSSALAADAGKG